MITYQKISTYRKVEYYSSRIQSHPTSWGAGYILCWGKPINRIDSFFDPRTLLDILNKTYTTMTFQNNSQTLQTQ